MKILKYTLILISLILLAPTSNACELPVISVKTCLGTTTWQSWNSDYDKVKEICAGTPINFDVRCSSGSLLSGTDEIIIYEIDENGNELMVYCGDYASLDFTPETDKKYRIEVNRDNSTTYEVTFETVDCLDFEISQPSNPNPNCLKEGLPIKFTLPFLDINSCYYFEWDFDDCSSLEYTTELEWDHVFELSPSKLCQSFDVTLKLISYGGDLPGCENCPDLEITKTITVCKYCPVVATHPDNFPTIIATPNPTFGPVDIVTDYTGTSHLSDIIITRIWDGTIIHTSQLPQNATYPLTYPFDLSSFSSGAYNVTVISAIGESGNTVVIKE